MDVNISFPSPKPAFDYRPLLDLAPHMIWAIVMVMAMVMVMVIVMVIAMIGPKRLATAFLNARKISFGGHIINARLAA